MELGFAQEPVDSDAAHAVRTRDVHFAYPARGGRPGGAALRGIDLDISPGQTVARLRSLPSGSWPARRKHSVGALLPPDQGWQV
jgi:hypothetical protein